jgi:hypothetical protein
MDRSYYLDRLYPLQDRVLGAFAGADTGFYLSGGTAASRGYLHHRFSDDLDLFVNDAAEFGLWSQRLIRSMEGLDDLLVEVELREERFVRFAVSGPGVLLKIELINDVPAHIGEIRQVPPLGRLDSAGNIFANKITALVDRDEPKDLADVWGFACRLGLSIETAIGDAHGKAAGIFPADLARKLIGASATDWSLVKWMEPPPQERFLADLRALGESLIL